MLRNLSAARNSEDGFTLIELLIVVIIIGILAAIALPIFLNQQKAAVDAKIKSDVRNTIDNVQTYLISGTPSAVTNSAIVASSGDVITLTITSDGIYKVWGSNSKGSAYDGSTAAKTYYYDSSTGNFGQPTTAVAVATAAPTTPAAGGYATKTGS